MVHKFVKSKQSKRISAKKRYSIEKKVREHNRKVKKLARKKPKKHKRKDPGIPVSAPFREQVIQEAKERREVERLLMHERQAASRDQKVSEARKLDQLVASANGRVQQFEEKEVNPSEKEKGEKVVGDRSQKTYYKEFRKVVEAADVVLEVLDARDPIGSRCAQVEEAVLNAGTSKRLVLVLNKIDLVPLENVKEWLLYLRNEFPAVPFKASTQSQQARLSRGKLELGIAKQQSMETSRCLGAELLLKLLGNYCRNQGIRTAIRVGVVGFPNVGKSSIINSLKRSKACNVGSVPGITKSIQEIHLDKHVVLLDSPGIVMAKNTTDSAAALRNAVKVETLEDPVKPVLAILARASKDQLRKRYNIADYKDAQEFLALLAKKKGRLKKGGVPDSEKAARILLHDWNLGVIKYYTRPPESQTVHISAEFVQTMAKEFDINALLEDEGETMKGQFSEEAMLVESSGQLEGTDEGVAEKMAVDDQATSLENRMIVQPVTEKKKTGKGDAPRKEKEKMVDRSLKLAFDDAGNQTLNRATKAQFKKILKDRKRRAKREKATSSAAMDESEDYNFSTDFLMENNG